MKCIRLHLLLLTLLLISISAFAGPRSFRQAKQIAERQAALLGIVMDESAQSQAKSFGFGDKTQKSQASDQETASYYVFMFFLMVRERVSRLCRAMIVCRKS